MLFIIVGLSLIALWFLSDTIPTIESQIAESKSRESPPTEEEQLKLEKFVDSKIWANTGTGDVPKLTVGIVVSPALARVKPPQSPLYRNEQVVCSIGAQSLINIVGIEYYAGLQGDYVWYKISTALLDNPACVESGLKYVWVYGGTVSGSENVRIMSRGD